MIYRCSCKEVPVPVRQSLPMVCMLNKTETWLHWKQFQCDWNRWKTSKRLPSQWRWCQLQSEYRMNKNEYRTFYEVSLWILNNDKQKIICRYARAERDLKGARPFGIGAQKFYEVAEIKPTADNPKELLVAMTSDRGKENLSNWAAPGWWSFQFRF